MSKSVSFIFFTPHREYCSSLLRCMRVISIANLHKIYLQMPKIFYRNILSVQQRCSYKQEVSKLVSPLGSPSRQKEIIDLMWHQGLPITDEWSNENDCALKRHQKGVNLQECAHAVKWRFVKDRHSCRPGNCCAAQSLIFIRLLPWKRHVSDAYRLPALCSELCWRTPIWQNQTSDTWSHSHNRTTMAAVSGQQTMSHCCRRTSLKPLNDPRTGNLSSRDFIRHPERIGS